MAADLIDFRLKITAEAACALAAFARANDIDKAEVGRDVIDAWARKQIHGARLLESCLRAKGLTGATEGAVGADGRSSAHPGDSLSWEDQ